MKNITEADLTALIRRGEEHNYGAKTAKENNVVRVEKIRDLLEQLPDDDFTSDPRQPDYALLKGKVEAFLDKGTFTTLEVAEIKGDIQRLLNYVYDALESELNEASNKS